MLNAWLTDDYTRVFPLGPQGGKKTIELLAARGERVAFQACFAAKGIEFLVVSCSVKAPAGVTATVRRVGSVPLERHNTGTPIEEMDGVGLVPGYVPDALFPELESRFAMGPAHAFWITLDVAPNAKPGVKTVTVTLNPEFGKPITLKASVMVSKVKLEPRQDFRITHWFYADAICDWYNLNPWDEDCWAMCEKYMRDYAEHGLDTIYVPCFTPPLDGVKRPTQLLKVTPRAGGKYAFDWSDVSRWIKVARSCGITHFEWTHPFTQWGVKHAIRIYQKKNGEDVLLWDPETPATSDTYRNFLSQYLPALKKFLQSEKALDKTFFHVSDEPHGEEHLANYRAARGMLQELAPWMKVMDALSEIEYGRNGLTDIPVPSIQTTKAFVDEGIDSWTYYCCGPRGKYLNRLLDTPLAKIRMNGWLFYRFQRQGFLHWGYNYWYKSQTRELIQPFFQHDGLRWPWWASGDCFVVYPGEDGPVPSIRWEVFHASMQDYALLQQHGIDPNGAMLRSLKDFDDFPKSAAWIRRQRKKLLMG